LGLAQRWAQKYIDAIQARQIFGIYYPHFLWDRFVGDQPIRIFFPDQFPEPLSVPQLFVIGVADTII
jgi:hypothetical protein